MAIKQLHSADANAVIAAGHLFDDPPRRDWTDAFLAREGHHLLVDYDNDVPTGFITGVEILHPDKGVEMLLYELGVDEEYRLRGIGRSLVLALLQLAADRGCSGMWVPIDPDNDAAAATYRSAGAMEPEAAAILAWEWN